MQENLGSDVYGWTNASAPRVLFTKWAKHGKKSVQTRWSSGLKKCGISIPFDWSEVNQIHIQGLEDYAVEEVKDYTDGDPFSDVKESENDDWQYVSITVLHRYIV